MSNEEGTDDSRHGWEHVGRAAEDFARRIARDAGRFAERLEEHAGDFARDVSRDWRRAQRHARRRSGQTCRQAAPGDVRRIFEDIRGVLTDVLDGVDELITRVFADAGEAPSAAWERVVSNRDATCSVCSRNVAKGEEVYLRRAAEGMEYRCSGCGEPAAG
jgi:hypothetical protein